MCGGLKGKMRAASIDSVIASSPRTPSMADPLLTFDVSDRIATITLQRPEKLNALNDAVMEALAAAITEARGRADVGAVLLTGAGRAFVAGADISELVDQSAAGGKGRAGTGQRTLRLV